MNKLDQFLNRDHSEQVEYLTNPNLERDSLNIIISNFSDQLEISLVVMAIEMNGIKLERNNINNLIKLESKEIMTALAANSQIKLDINQVRDMTRLVDDDVIKQHPDYKEFWYATYVQKEAEFLNHTLHHIKNVNILADEVLDFILEDSDLKSYFNIPEGIKNNVLKTVVREGMKLHDKAKICDDEEFLKEHKLNQPLYKTLYSYYGKGLTPELKLVVAQLNMIDQKIVADYLDNYDEWMKNLFFKIEKLADCIERGCNKVTPEEMQQTKIKPSKYLEKTMNPIELKIVNFFEENYSNYCKEIF